MTADYSQIEMRIMAHLSGDAALIEAFRSHHDFHAETAARVFGVDAAEVGPERRAKIKAMNYGLAYGLSAFGLSDQLRISTEEARGLMDDYFQTFGGVRDYLGGVVDQARKDGYTETILGRRRYLPDLTTDNRQRREMAERMALNAPIQGSAADIIKVAMLNVHRALRPRACAAACCCRCTTSWCSRSRTASATRSRSWCAGRWARRTRCRCRWRCRWATGVAGTRPRTEAQPVNAAAMSGTPARWGRLAGGVPAAGRRTRWSAGAPSDDARVQPSRGTTRCPPAPPDRRRRNVRCGEDHVAGLPLRRGSGSRTPTSTGSITAEVGAAARVRRRGRRPRRR